MIKRGLTWAMNRLSLTLLLLAQPIFATWVLFSRFSADTIKSLLFPFSVLTLIAGIDATLRIKKRMPLLRGIPKFRKGLADDLFEASTDLVNPIIAVVIVQMSVRRTSTIATDPESLRLLGYTPTPQSIESLLFAAALWGLIVAYVMKYYWDDAISILQAREKPETVPAP